MRAEFSRKVKAEAFARCGGYCEGTSPDGSRCGLKLQTGRFTYDHRVPDWMGGKPTLDNCQVLGWCCDKPKTAKDQGNIAKVRRVQMLHAGIRKPRTITAWRRFDGSIVRAQRER